MQKRCELFAEWNEGVRRNVGLRGLDEASGLLVVGWGLGFPTLAAALSRIGEDGAPGVWWWAGD